MQITSQDDIIIGGPGFIVEIDDKKLAKRKYRSGCKCRGDCVITDIERTENKKKIYSSSGARTTESTVNLTKTYVKMELLHTLNVCHRIKKRGIFLHSNIIPTTIKKILKFQSQYYIKTQSKV